MVSLQGPGSFPGPCFGGYRISVSKVTPCLLHDAQAALDMVIVCLLKIHCFPEGKVLKYIRLLFTDIIS